MQRAIAATRLSGLVMAFSVGGMASAAVPELFPPVFNLANVDGVNGFRVTGERHRDGVGYSVSSAGDINGDGIADLVIGAPYACISDCDSGNAHRPGAAYVIFGQGTASTEDFVSALDLSSLDGSNGFRVDGELSFDMAGASVSSAGDVNGDGIDDLIVGAPAGAAFNFHYRKPGASYVIFGRDTANTGNFPATIKLSSLDGTLGFRLLGTTDYDSVGLSVSGAGDVNGDGIDDLVIGGPLSCVSSCGSFSEHRPGAAYVVFGRDTVSTGDFPGSLRLSSLDGSNGFRVEGHFKFGYAGRSVSAAGDINGDGLDDLIIGVKEYASDRPGASYVVFGRNTASTGDFPASMDVSNLDGSNGFRIVGEMLYDGFGTSVSTAGDVNGDGFDDLIIGAPDTCLFGCCFIGCYPPVGSRLGAAYVIFGRDTVNTGDFPASLSVSTLNGRNGFRLEGENDHDAAGKSVSSAGDINGDGVDDLVIGASYVVFGRNTAYAAGFPASWKLSTLDGENGFRLDGALKSDQAGRSVSAAGDINNDGIDDLVIGAPFACIANCESTDGASRSGAGYVVFGHSDHLETRFYLSVPVWDLTGSYAYTLDARFSNFNMTYPVVHGGNGNVTGSGGRAIFRDSCRAVDFNTLEFAGKVRRTKHGPTLKGHLRSEGIGRYYCTDKEPAVLYNVPYRLDLILTQIVADDGSVSGRAKGKLCGKGVGCLKISRTFQTQLPSAMNGNASLSLTVDEEESTPEGKNVTGTGEITLANGRKLAYRPAEATCINDKNLCTWTLVGDESQDTYGKLKLVTDFNATQVHSLKGKVLGWRITDTDLTAR